MSQLRSCHYHLSRTPFLGGKSQDERSKKGHVLSIFIIILIAGVGRKPQSYITCFKAKTDPALRTCQHVVGEIDCNTAR